MAYQHIFAGLSAEGAAADAISGYGFYRYLRSGAEGFAFARILAPMEGLMRQLNRLPLTVSVTGRVPLPLLEALCDGLGGPETGPTVTLSRPVPCRDAILIPSRGGLRGAGGATCTRLGKQEHGAALPAGAKILSLNYLWNRVRVQGAPTAPAWQWRANGDVFACSYRDPNPANTLQVFRSAPGLSAHLLPKPGVL